VTARNTLDHSYDPIRAIREMLDFAKPGAPLLLVHHRNTAEDESYHGMHQWNFEAGDDSLVVWRPGTRTDIARQLEDQCTVETHWLDGTWEHVVLRKHAAPRLTPGQRSAVPPPSRVRSGNGHVLRSRAGGGRGQRRAGARRGRRHR